MLLMTFPLIFFWQYLSLMDLCCWYHEVFSTNIYLSLHILLLIGFVSDKYLSKYFKKIEWIIKKVQK